MQTSLDKLFPTLALCSEETGKTPAWRAVVTEKICHA